MRARNVMAIMIPALSILCTLLIACGGEEVPSHAAAAGEELTMTKRVTDGANFVVYAPEDWIVKETAGEIRRTLRVSDPGGTLPLVEWMCRAYLRHLADAGPERS